MYGLTQSSWSPYASAKSRRGRKSNGDIDPNSEIVWDFLVSATLIVLGIGGGIFAAYIAYLMVVEFIKALFAL